MAPMLKALDDSHKLLVRSGVVGFYTFKLLGIECNRVPFLGVVLEL